MSFPKTIFKAIPFLLSAALFIGCQDSASTSVTGAPDNNNNHTATVTTRVFEYPETKPGDMPETPTMTTMEEVMDNVLKVVQDKNSDIDVKLTFGDNNCTIAGNQDNIRSFYTEIGTYIDTVDEVSMYLFKEEATQSRGFFKNLVKKIKNKVPSKKWWGKEFTIEVYPTWSTEEYSNSHSPTTWILKRSVKFRYQNSAIARFRALRDSLEWHYGSWHVSPQDANCSEGYIGNEFYCPSTKETKKHSIKKSEWPLRPHWQAAGDRL